MSRSGYVDDGDDPGRLNLYRGTVARTINGKRGQAFLREMAAALDAMPVKELIANDLVDGERACAIGSVALARKLDVSDLDEGDYDGIASLFGISTVLTREIEYENDEVGPSKETPAERWQRMREWVRSQLRSWP